MRIVVRAATMVAPWCAAKAAFKPPVGAGRKDKLLDWLSFLRATIGLAVVTFAFSGFREVGDVLAEAYWKVLETTFTGLFIVGLMLLIAYPFFARRSRVQTRRALIAMAVRGGSLLGVLVLLTLVFFMGLTFAGALDQHRVVGEVVFWSMLPAIWVSLFAACAYYWAARNCLWVSYVDPLLAPLGSSIITVRLTTSEIGEGDSKGVPYWIWCTVTLFGLVSSLALAYFEYRHIVGSGKGTIAGYAHDGSLITSRIRSWRAAQRAVKESAAPTPDVDAPDTASPETAVSPEGRPTT